MRSGFAFGAWGAVVVVATTVSLIIAPAGYAADPTPTPSVVSVPVTVVIPGPSGSASPSASPSPSSTSTGGGGGGTGTGTGTGGPITDADGDLPTLPDGSPIPPSKPTDGAPKLVLDKDSIPVGEWIIATGTGYAPGEKVQFVLYPGAIIIGSFLADSTGKVEARFRMTEFAPAGDYVVEATGWQSAVVKNAPFQVFVPGAAGAFPWLWWVLVVLGVLLAALIATLIYFRRPASRLPAGGLAPTGPTP